MNEITLSKVYQRGDLTLNFTQRVATLKGEHVHLQPKEYELLELLADNAGTLMTKPKIMDALYPTVSKPAGKVIDVFICNTRKKLGHGKDDRVVIETVWGKGYRMPAPDAPPIP